MPFSNGLPGVMSAVSAPTAAIHSCTALATGDDLLRFVSPPRHGGPPSHVQRLPQGGPVQWGWITCLIEDERPRWRPFVKSKSACVGPNSLVID